MSSIERSTAYLDGYDDACNGLERSSRDSWQEQERYDAGYDEALAEFRAERRHEGRVS